MMTIKAGSIGIPLLMKIINLNVVETASEIVVPLPLLQTDIEPTVTGRQL